MRVRTLIAGAALVAAAAAGAWALGLFGETGAGPAPAGDADDDPAAAAAGLSAAAKKAAAAAAPETAVAKPRGAVVGTVRSGGEGVAARVEAYAVGNALFQEYAPVTALSRIRAFAADAAVKPTAVVSAAADGKFAFEGLAPGVYDLVAVGAAGGFGQTRAILPAEGARVSVLLSLSVGGETLRGRVRAADGGAWRGEVATSGGPSAASRASASLRARTDEEGRFAFTGLPAGPVVVVAMDPGVRLWVSRPVTLPRTEEWTWTLPADVECAGTVVAASDGKPIAGAAVTGDSYSSAELEDALVATTTDEAGRFRFGWPGGRGAVEASAAGFRRASLAVGDPAERPTIRLVRPSRLVGRVLADAGGAPVGGVTLLARSVAAWDGTMPSAVSLADGTYEFAAVPAGEVALLAAGGGWVAKGTLEAKENGYNPLVVEVPLEGKATFDVVVTRGGRAEGRVLDPTGAPVAGAQVSPSFTGNQRQLSWMLTTMLTTASGGDGAFAFDGVPATAMFEVTATAVGFVQGRAGPFRADPAAPVKTEVRLSSGTYADVAVVERGTKTPIAGASVTGWYWEPNGSGGSVPEAVTGADGRARVGPFVAGNVMFQASALGHGSGSTSLSAASEGTPTIELKPALGTGITGRVEFADGGSTAGLNVWVVIEAGDDSTQQGVEQDGSFRFSSVPTGPVKLSARLGWGDDSPVTTLETTAGAENVRLVFSIPRPSTITVRVVDAGGSPVPVFKQANAGSPAASNYGDGRDGRIDLYGVQKDTWILVYKAQDATGAPLPLAATVAGPFPAGRSPVEVRLLAERVIEGVVRAADGTGLRGVLLSARALSVPPPLASAVGLVHGQARTDERGAFRIGGLGTGEYVLTVSTPPEVPAPPPVAVAAGQTRVEIELGRGTPVEITVVGSDGRPLLGASVVVRAPGQRQRLAPSGSTDAAGVARIAGLDPAGRYELNVAPPRGSGAGLAKKVPGWAPRNETVRLDPAFLIKGVIRKGDGKPLPGASVTAYPATGGADEGLLYSRTNADGAFTFEGVAEGGYKLSARTEEPRFETADVFAEAGAQDVVLMAFECPGKLVVTLEGWPESETQSYVQLMREGAERDVNSAVGAQVVHGVATIEGLRLDASYTLYAGLSGGLVAHAKGLKAGTATVAVKAGKTIQGRIKLPATRTNANVWVEGLWGVAVKVEPDGAFVVTGVPEGTWKVIANAMVGDGWWSADARVEAGGTVDLEPKPK